MDQILILVLFVVASIVSSIIQNRKKRQEAEEMARAERGETPAPLERPRPPFQEWPQTAEDWKRELRRMLEQPGSENPVPPSVPPYGPKPTPPVIVSQPKPAPAPSKPARTWIPVSTSGQEPSEGELELENRLKASEAAYARASALHARVQDRLAEVARATGTHASLGSEAHRPISPLAARFRNRQTAREAFVASVIFSPPLAFQAADPGAGRPGA